MGFSFKPESRFTMPEASKASETPETAKAPETTETPKTQEVDVTKITCDPKALIKEFSDNPKLAKCSFIAASVVFGKKSIAVGTVIEFLRFGGYTKEEILKSLAVMLVTRIVTVDFETKSLVWAGKDVPGFPDADTKSPENPN